MEERTMLYCNSLEECEEELRQLTWQRIQERVKEQRAIMDQKLEEIRQQSSAQLEATLQQQLLELRQMNHQLMMAEQESMVMIEQEMRDKMDEYRNHNESSQKRYSETMDVIQQANVRSQERRRRRSTKCSEIKQEATQLLDVLSSIMKTCKYPQLLEDVTSKMAERGRQSLTKAVTDLDHMIHNQSATNENIAEYRQMVSTVASYLGDIKVAMEMANKKGDEQLKLKQQREKEEQLKIAEKKAKEEAKKAAVAADFAASCSPVGRYNNAVTEIANLQKKLEPLKSKDPEIKKLRLKLLSSVNHPVNAIAPHTRQHLLDKVQRLKTLLEGRVVTTADRTVSIREHPLALDYCTKELADKLVRQGDTQVSAKPEAAFAVAAVAIAMAVSFPRVRDLIVAHFYSSCPILVPIYIPKTGDISEDDHKRMQGYRVVGGILESEENYYKRISGIIRLYAAIIQYPVPKDVPHPHGPEHGWAWLANILNTEPRNGITATALLNFLEVAGYRLMECYGRQFVKLLRLLGSSYMPMIEKVTASDQKGSFVRLQLFLEKITKASSIPKPPGYITVDLTRT